jgi:hypothetical protein
MNDAPIQIRNPEVARAIRELAEKSGRPITEAVGEAVQAALRQCDSAEQARRAGKLASIREAVARLQALPTVGQLLTDDDIYDEDGLPK